MHSTHLKCSLSPNCTVQFYLLYLGLSLYHSDLIFCYSLFYSVATLAAFLSLNCPLTLHIHTQILSILSCLGVSALSVPLPTMLFLQILTWLTPATPSNLCSNLIFSMEHILTLLLKNHSQLYTNPAFILFSLGLIPCEYPKWFMLFFSNVDYLLYFSLK